MAREAIMESVIQQIVEVGDLIAPLALSGNIATGEPDVLTGDEAVVEP